MKKSLFYLGVDGGGTSTTAAVADEKGKVLGTGKAGPSLYKVVGLKGAMENIRKAIVAAEQKARLRTPRYVYSVFGLSGVDSMKDWELLSKLIYGNFKSRVGDRFRVVNDVVIALAAGTRAQYGVALVAGTGSNAYAVGPRGEAYASGLGSLLADEGGAYWIGLQVLRAAVKSFDGRGSTTMLEQLLCTKYHLRTLRDLVNIMYLAEFDKTSIARLAPLCTRAAKQGDRVAHEIFQRAAVELADMVTAVVRRAGLARTRFDCVLSGGVFKVGKEIIKPFTHAVEKLFPFIHLIRFRSSPVIGAIQLARTHHDRIT